MLHATHDAYLGEVTTWLEDRGYFTGEVTYHEALAGQPVLDALRCNESITAHYVRTRADRVAVHAFVGHTFQYDAKTSRGDDILLEALPIAFHALHAQMGVECLYCYRNPKYESDLGFWVSPDLCENVCRIQFPRFRWDERDEEMAELVRHWRPLFPNARFCKCNGGSSGDPHIVIPRDVALSLPSWQGLVTAALSRSEN